MIQFQDTGRVKETIQFSIKMRTKLILFLISISLASTSFGQGRDSCDLKFAAHLVDGGNFREALFVLDSSDCSFTDPGDSADYLRGWSYYSLKELDVSNRFLLKVSEKSHFYPKSRFFSAYNSTYLGDFDSALKILAEEKIRTGAYQSINSFESAGIYLLVGDTASFRKSLWGADANIYAISKSYENIRKIASDLKNHKPKSRFVAGLFSAVIPGSGKFYSGMKGGAISAFIATAGLGLVALENYRKHGPESFAAIAFGTAFAFSYVSNIYGSVAAAGLVEKEYRKNVKNSILFNLHIPLRNYFDK